MPKLSGRRLATFIREKGPANYVRMQGRLLGLTPDGRIPVGPDGKSKFPESVRISEHETIPRMRPSDFSLRALWEGLVGPVEETLEFAQSQYGYVEAPLREAVSTGSFATAVGQLIATMVIDGYESTASIADRLVAPMESNLRGERIVGFTHLQAPKEVAEGMPYEDSTFADKFVGSRETKRGRLLTVTEESVYFDQTGQILERARQLGEVARQERERRIVRAVIDADSAEPIYQPSGTGEQLYSAGNNNLVTGVGALQDWTDIQEVLQWHAQNVTDDRETDDNLGPQPIMWNPRQLLTAVGLAGTAARIVTATQFGGGSSDTISGNPLNQLAPGLDPLSSPFFDGATTGDQHDDNTDWFLGDFPRQFKEKIVWALATVRIRGDEVRDVLAGFKVRSYSDVLATDERFVMKVDASA